MHGFYLQTFAEYGNSPALTLEFLRHLARRDAARSWCCSCADATARPIAGALCLRGGDTLYGRYWGAARQLPGLHFETCYYQGIDYCLREGLRVFEPGAQGEHKIARGFLPALVRSRHWIADPAFAGGAARTGARRKPRRCAAMRTCWRRTRHSGTCRSAPWARCSSSRHRKHRAQGALLQ